MPYSFFKRKCGRHTCVPYLLFLFCPLITNAQLKWDGEAGDGQWATATNWAGNVVPAAGDDVLLDNSIVAGNYIVSLPGSMATVTIKTLALSPANGSAIQCILPASSTAVPAFTTTGPVYGILINNGGVFVNASSAASGAPVVINDSLRINNGGQYIHNTRSAHAAMVTVLSKNAGTETGVFIFDVPGGGYTLASTNRTYGTLVLSAAASGGTQVYATSAANPLTINGNFILQDGVTVNLDITAATVIKGSYVQLGGVFNLASQANNNTVYIQGDFIQTAGTITETSTGLPAIELNGTNLQNIQIAGSIINSVGFSISNSAGVALLSDLALPYSLHLADGIVKTGAFLITLQAGCSIQADSLSNTSFINGRLRKEGLTSADHFLFPVGKDITQRWLALKEVSGNYTVEFFKSNPRTLAMPVGPGIHHTSSIEYWSVQVDGNPAPVAKIELSFDNVNSGGVTDMTTLRVAQLGGGEWMNKGNTSTTGTPGSAGSVVSNSNNAFNAGDTYFTLASSNAFQNPLPLVFLSFYGNALNDAVVLHWQVADSWQPVSFELQSSADGIHFIVVSTISAVLNQTTYQYADKRKLSGIQYYRLKATAHGGSFFYAADWKLNTNTNVAGPVQLWPSVVKSTTTVVFDAISNSSIQVGVYSIDGRIVQTTKAVVYKGRNAIQLQLPSLPAGCYTVSITGANNAASYGRFIKSD